MVGQGAKRQQAGAVAFAQAALKQSLQRTHLALILPGAEYLAGRSQWNLVLIFVAGVCFQGVQVAVDFRQQPGGAFGDNAQALQ